MRTIWTMFREWWAHLTWTVVWQGETIVIRVGDVHWALVLLAAGWVVSRRVGNYLRRRMEEKDVLSAAGREATVRWTGLVILFFAVLGGTMPAESRNTSFRKAMSRGSEANTSMIRPPLE